jgi:hypothetical protein
MDNLQVTFSSLKILSISPIYTAEGTMPGCMPQWATLDQFGYMNGYPINLLQLLRDQEHPENNLLRIPSIQAVLRRPLNDDY